MSTLARAALCAHARRAALARGRSPIARARAYVAHAGGSFENVTSDDLREMIETADDSDVMFVDVREKDEWDALKVRRFELKPLSDVGSWLNALPREKKLVVMCKLGGRSARACDALVAAGYDNVYNVLGGITEYSEKYGSD
ncbi:Rhodanese-like domain [Ostreococcus tauri]|uniref:Rhodanese-like domain n=1 Tax=Ostreococcus tauri TaxID=70448 RepID=Q00ZS4_OSTTA|nr:Rhodanese-like domain [Ostreococcus tauri]OUS43267.1 Rhodanese-like domain-containing protein [Ostreococcus tauri]CAL56208.1 Rhodanese-like domain [Ostreococcus tauri]|eukprot:XP_003081684.1 Rhodanese-like domain [Ostreococcus tauri]